ncbi:hypothetical protein FSARC_2333 [Fusarium sarcochroum]|uniref:F-box domain-containing protein n=1 Tax=Fusarium sarcochroum TaxID=1208366 RepID=A0A8H4U6N4_9HYPO|nr:hypothetical protein FSARC_2333 [Fusarium sarcochroum]
MIPIRDLVHSLLVKLRFTSPKSPPRKKQGPKCFLLNVPLEIFYLIFDRLPVCSQMCLLVACYDTYHTLSPLRSQILRYGLEARIGYLGLLARDYPDHWVDDATAMLIKMKNQDLPKAPEGPPVFKTPGWGCHNIDLFERGALMLEHKHVQIAVKYSQLQNKTLRQKRYLKALLKPYETEFSPGFEMHPNYASSLIGKFWTCPKIVSGSYLVFNKWHFIKKDGPIHLGELRRFGPCLHQYVEPRRYHNFIRRKLYSTIGCSIEQATGTYLMPKWGSNHRDCSDKFFGCLRLAFHKEGKPVNGFNAICVEGLRRSLLAFKSERDPLEIRARYGDLPTEGRDDLVNGGIFPVWIGRWRLL